MSELLRDVDEMMRQERLMAIWRQWGNVIIGAILAVIVAVALNQGYQAWYQSKSEKLTAGITAALKEKDPVAALVTFADTHSGNAAVMARLLAAGKMVGKPDTAIPLLLAARNESGAAKDLRDMATLQWVRLSAGQKDADADALLAALTPLMADEGLPTAWSARLEAATITANLKNDPAAAIKLLEPMSNNPALPMTQVERAEALINVYSQRSTATGGTQQ